MSLLFKILLLSILCLHQLVVCGQERFACGIEIPSSFTKKFLRISYNNDQASYKRVKINKTDSVVSISDTVFTRYVAVSISYIDSIFPSKSFRKILFVSKGSSRIKCLQNTTTQQLVPAVVMNGIDSDSIGGMALKRFIEKEESDLNQAYTRFMQSTDQGDSIRKDLFRKGELVNQRKLDFIVSFPATYFSMWLFRTSICLSKQHEIDSLVNIYSRVFPDSLKNTGDGDQTKKVLLSRIQARSGSEAVNFNAKTVSGKSISYDNYKGKYLLLDFWASWCVPCIKQIPKVEAILHNIDSTRISVLAISHDSQYDNFIGAVKKYKIRWEQVYGNSKLPQDFAVVTIPQLILINDQGKVIYNMEDQNDYSLTKFKAMIDTIFN